MPLALPPSPTLGQIEPYNGKNWRWMGTYWSAVSQFAISQYDEIPYDKNDMSRLNMVFSNKVVPA